MISTAKLRHHNKSGLVKMCIAKESDGYECVRPIERVDNSYKHFRRDRGAMEFQHVDVNGYYQAIYQKEFLNEI